MAWTRVCGRGEVTSSETLAVTAAGRRVLLVDVAGTLRAYEDRCPHKGVPLSEGTCRASTLTCRAHEWTFDARTGAGINPASASLAPVPFIVSDDAVWIEDPRGEERAGADRERSTHDGAGTAGARPIRTSAAPGALVAPPGSPRAVASAPAAAGCVGPVLLAGAITDAVVDAIRDRHADARVVDQGSYLRIFVPGRCVIRAEDVRARLRAPFRIPSDLEPLMCSFKGVFTASEDEAVFETARPSGVADRRDV